MLVFVGCLYLWGAYKRMVNTRAAMEIFNTGGSYLMVIATEFRLALA